MRQSLARVIIITFALRWLVHKLQVCKLVSIEFAPSNVNGRQFSNLQMDFAISTFGIIEKMASG